MTQRWTLFIFLTLSMFGLHSAVRCYICRSVAQKGCGERAEFHPAYFRHKSERGCGVCLMMTSVVMGVTVVERACRQTCPKVADPLPDYLADVDYKQYCCSDKDGCNKATDAIPSLAIILAGVAAVWIVGHAS